MLFAHPLAWTFRRKPALIHLACVLTMLALLTPPLLSISIPGHHWLTKHWAAAPAVAAEIESSDRSQAASNERVPEPTEAEKFQADPEMVSRLESTRFPLSKQETTTEAWIPLTNQVDATAADQRANMVIPLIIGCWLIGSLVCLLRTARQIFRFRKLAAHAQLARPELKSLVQRESERIRLRQHPIVQELNAVVSPFVFLSAGGTKLAMPSGLIDELTEEETRALILHELTHIQRRDPVVRVLELVVSTLFWFNPAVWITRYHLRRTEELACDAVVIDSWKNQPEVYANAFLKTLDFLSHNRIQHPPLVVCTASSFGFCKQRLQAIAEGTNQVGTTKIQAAALCLIALPFLLVGFQTNSQSGQIINEPLTNQTTLSETDLSARVAVDVGGRSTTETPVSMAMSDQADGERDGDHDAGQLTSIDKQVMGELSATKETPKLIFHYRPSDVDAEQLAQIVDANLQQYRQCESSLNMKYPHRIHIFLYRDIDDLQQMTGVGASAFATGTISIHQPLDFRSVHELTHIFALEFPSDENAVTDDFAVEGLATILAEHDENIPIHSWAAVYQSKARLPDLVKLRRSWPEGVLPGVHPYHVAGSFVGYLIDQYGIEKVKRWYVQSTEAHMEFGKTFRQLEREWQNWLRNRNVIPQHRSHVLAKLGLLPEMYAKLESINLFEGNTLEELETEHRDHWKTDNGLLVGSNAEGWTSIYTEQEFASNVGVRLKFRLVEGKAITVRLNQRNDSSNHVNLATWATYMSLNSGGYVVIEDLKLKHGQWNEVVVVNDAGNGKLYHNGLRVGVANGAFHLTKGKIGIGVENGTIEVKEFAMFELPSKR